MKLLLFLLLLNACQPGRHHSVHHPATAPDTGRVAETPYAFPYRLQTPAATFALPAQLTEISALGMSSGFRQLCTLQDEQARLYFLDKNTGAVLSELPFGTEGDFEGVEIVDSTAYAIKSNGSLYCIRGLEGTPPQVEKIRTPLDKSYDIEGLAWDPAGQRLLIGCKGAGAGSPDSRQVFAFDPARRLMDENPRFAITLDMLRQYILRFVPAADRDKYHSWLEPSDGEFKFGISGLAVHPLSGDLYLLSSPGKLLVVLGMDGTLRHVEKLQKELFLQPEGITFDQDGTLYISNEGKKGQPAVLYRFAMSH